MTKAIEQDIGIWYLKCEFFPKLWFPVVTEEICNLHHTVYSKKSTQIRVSHSNVILRTRGWWLSSLLACHALVYNLLKGFWFRCIGNSYEGKCFSRSFVVFWDQVSLALNSLCSPGWPWTWANSQAFVSKVLGLQVLPAMPRLHNSLSSFVLFRKQNGMLQVWLSDSINPGGDNLYYCSLLFSASIMS